MTKMAILGRGSMRDKQKVSFSNEFSPFNAGIKSFRATLPAEVFYWGF
jgi:hypothetical protein